MCKSNKGPKYYGRNIFGDIVEIYDASGNVVAKYTYNAWGEVLSVTGASGNAITSSSNIGNLNPLRYRGYYYDSETGFYYLQSRYYDPVTKRFLNADETSILLTTPKELFNKNLYSYCDNSPIIRKDSSGECWFLVGALFGVITQYVCDVASNLMNGETFVESLTPKSTWADYLSAAVSGAVATTGIGLLGSITINAALGGATYLVNCDIKGVEADPENLFLSTVIGGVAGATGGKGANLSEAQGIINTSKKIISSTVSASVRQQYANKITLCFKGIVKSAIRAFSAGVVSNAFNRGRKYITDSIS